MENFKMIKNAAAIIVFFRKKLNYFIFNVLRFSKMPHSMVYRARYNKIFDKSKFCQFLNFYQGKRKTYKLSRR